MNQQDIHAAAAILWQHWQQSTRLDEQPASGPSTRMCCCPAVLVAAIFQPTMLWPDNFATSAWIA